MPCRYQYSPPTPNKEATVLFTTAPAGITGRKGSGVQPLLAPPIVSVSNQISERETERQREAERGSWFFAAFVVSGPFLETAGSYSPLENREALRE